MPGVREFTLPDLGEGLTEATVVRWLVAIGDVVAVDQPVVEVETAKALVDVPCPYGGVVTARYGEEGAEIPVGAPLVTVAGASSDGAGAESGSPGTASGSAAQAPATPAPDGAAAQPEDSGSGNVLVGYGTGGPVGRRRRTRTGDSLLSPASPGSASAASGRTESEQTQAPPAVISPLVRRVARENGVDLRGITGSGPDGLILRADVEQAARSLAPSVPLNPPDLTAPGGQPAVPAHPPQAQEQAAQAGDLADPARAVERIPLTGFRGTVADKLSRSRREIPDATCWVDADATELLAARRAMNLHGAPTISLLALLARICTAALSRFPELNATVDTEAREIVRLPVVHLGFAAQTPRGLVVPVVRDAHTLDATRLSAELARLTESARTGTLTPPEMTGGTFTLNNYGVFGVDGSTPIINHPEAAMLGVGRIAEKPWVVDGELAVRRVVQLSFTFDHRVCDGGAAGGFLRHVADCVEQPAVLLRTL